MTSGGFCDACGMRNRVQARFCRGCGEPMHDLLSESPTLTTPPPPARGVAPEIVDAFADEYEVFKAIGKGGMGEVFLAREKALERDVAIKILPAEYAGQPHMVERFMREARIAAGLQHPNIVSIHRVGTVRKISFFTMDFIAGGNLIEFVAAESGGGLSPERVRAIVVQIAEALDHAHGVGVIHRDLKPANVMIDEKGHCTVMDFGLAKAAESSQLTVSGAILGTPRYMSPEQAEGRSLDHTSDLYSLGLIYYFLLARCDLVQGSNLAAVVATHLNTDLAAVVRSRDDLEPLDRNLIRRLIARYPSDRIRNASDVVAAVDRAGEGAATEPVSPLPPRTGSAEREPGSAEAGPPVAPPSLGTSSRKRLESLLDNLKRDGDDPDRG